MNLIHPQILNLISQGKINLGGGHVELQYLKELQLKPTICNDQKILNLALNLSKKILQISLKRL